MTTKKIQFDQQLHTIYLGTGHVSEEGIDVIQGTLAGRGIHLWPDNFDPACVVKSGEYTGTIVKRLRKFYHENGLDLNQNLCSEIGSIVGRYSTNKQEYTFHFTNRLWPCGKFQDGGSCFWSEKKATPQIIFDNGGGGVCFFDGEKGIGRAWILPYGEDWVIFNAYGLEIYEIVKVISTYLGLGYRKIQLSNYSDDDYLYINDSSQYVITSNLDKYNEDGKQEVELNIDTDYYYGICETCEDAYPVDDLNEINDAFYCDSCAQEFSECEYCSVMSKTTTIINHVTYCESCAKSVHQCEHCEEESHEDNMQNLEGVGWVCDTCADEYVLCPHCDNYHVNS